MVGDYKRIGKKIFAFFEKNTKSRKKNQRKKLTRPHISSILVEVVKRFITLFYEN
jgi:hypothetical protein